MAANDADLVPELTGAPVFSASSCIIGNGSCTGLTIDVPVDSQTGYINVVVCPSDATSDTCSSLSIGGGELNFTPAAAATKTVPLTFGNPNPLSVGTYGIQVSLCGAALICNQTDPQTYNYNSWTNPGMFTVVRYPAHTETETGVAIPTLTVNLP
jgi:hypothetical protein